MLWCPWAWLHSLRCRVFASSAATKTSENAEGQIVGLHVGSTAIYISATILLFLLQYSLLITSYNTVLAYQLTPPRVLRSTTPPLLLIAKVTVAERVMKAMRCDWLVATTNVVFAHTLATKLSEHVRVHWQQKSGRFNFRIGQTFVVLVWKTKDKKVLSSLKASVHWQLLGVSRQITRLTTEVG